MNKVKIIYSKYPLLYEYYVTDDGRVWSKKSNKFLSQQLDKDGYCKVYLRSSDLPPEKRHAYSVHRLIMENFYPFEGMESYQVNHIDGNKQNNNLNNLEWVSSQENIAHAISHGLRAEINGAAKLTKEQVIDICLRSNNGEKNVDLGKEYNVHPDTIGKIKNKKSWKNLLSTFND